MSDPFIGEIRIWATNYAPRGWTFCNGQLLPISQNTALFAIIGTTYGGNGTTNFAMPNLQATAPMAWGHAPGLSPRALGETGGSNDVTLLTTEMPQHAHTLQGRNQVGTSGTPQAGDFLGFDNAATTEENIRFLTNAPITRVNMSPAFVGAVGQSLPHENRQPGLALNFCIATTGIFPPRQ
ncbi:MAG: tail fiber protein [Xanthomonadaceae bacterium]|nr:tail fiber protein [Xanthomonadaceae bacterium]MDP2186354.1 tail fiber protein [Xanthomonadales bacterium]MDZ4117207.1 tail fiber protein [Xanthomonadaceae bacterium]MDZ4378822.1 tail fiber protein [Xanthomonadaceae bacterium]